MRCRSVRIGCREFCKALRLDRRAFVKAGVRLVTVDLGRWDTHVMGFDSLRREFLPRFDRAYSALIEDLDQRRLLSSTLVIAWGEFGRTPRVNVGRDHYSHVFSAALAGGPVQRGQVVGSCDAKAAYPLSSSKTPQDVLATVYRFLRIDLRRNDTAFSGRPVPTLPFSNPIQELS